MAIDKLIYNTDNAELLKAAGNLASLVDTRSQIKEASSSAISKELIEQNKPDDDHFAIHYIALGDYERFSHNRNGDAFTKEACKNYHDTFLTHAHYFREHNNRDPKNSIGVIKAAAYNEPMGRVELIVHGDKRKAEDVYENIKQGKDLGCSMACFPANTPILTYNGFKPIQSIATGDFVLTHTGNYHKVYDTMARVADELYTIKTRFFGGVTLDATEEHPIYTVKLQEKDKASWGKNKTAQFVETSLEFLPIKDLTVEHHIAIPFIKTTKDALTNPKFAKFLGYVLGDGCISFCKGNPNGLMFTVNYNDLLPLEIEDLVLSEGFEDVVKGERTSSTSSNAFRFDIYSSKLGKLCLELLEGSASNKTIPKGLWNSSKEVVCEFFKGWLNSAGWQDSKGIHISTAIFEQAYLAQNLLLKNGIQASICKIEHKERKCGEYVVNISNYYSNLFSEGLSKIKHIEKTHIKNIVYSSENYYYIPISSISKNDTNELVYNFSVENDESYTAFGLTVHNCKVAYDVSSVTGKKQHTRNEYDEYCKHRLGQYIPEQEKYAFVFNPEPKFFDLSHVAKPADRIAYALNVRLSDSDLEKAASEYQLFENMGSAERAERLGLNLTEDSSILGCIDISKRATLNKLSELEKFASDVLIKNVDVSDKNTEVNFLKHAAVNAFDPEEQLTQAQLDRLNKLRPGTFFAELSKHACVLPFISFAAYVTGDSILAAEQSDVVKYAMIKELPCIFTSMMDKSIGDLEEMFDADDSFCCDSDPENNDEVQQIMDDVKDKFGIEAEPMKQRVMKITITKKASVQAVDQAELTELENKLSDENKFSAKKLASAYGMYKIATINHLNKNNQHSVDNLTLLTIITQNLTK